MADNNKIVNSSSGKPNETIRNLFRNLTYIPNIKAIEKLIFLISNTKKAFNYLWLAIIKALIF